MKRVRAIHISDIHYENNHEGNELLDKLKDDLVMMYNELGKFDVMIITGDIVNKGHVQDYKEFKKHLNRIIREIDLSKSRVFIVAGNHDTSHNNTWLTGKTDSEENVDAWKKVAGNYYEHLYPEFINAFQQYGSKGAGVGVRKINIGGAVSVKIVMLNSSCSTALHNVYGDLYIGQSQIEKIRKEFGNKNNEITIACMHHPLDWFSYEERVKLKEFIYRELECDILLHGHLHEATLNSVSTAELAVNTFCTGISYERAGEHSTRKDGMRYSIYEIDKGLETVNVYLRTTGDEGNFTWDNRLYSNVNENGRFTIPFGNTNKCTFPMNTVSANDRRYILLNYQNMKLVLDDEKQLFALYRGMEHYIEGVSLTVNSECKKYKEKWIGKTKSNDWTLENFHKCEKEYYVDLFETFCLKILIDLNGLIFEKPDHVRFLLRRFDKESMSHIAFLAEGKRSTSKDIESIRSFRWGEGMIFNAYQAKKPLLMSCNEEHHMSGNSKGVWVDYLTIAIVGTEIIPDTIPLITLNIAIDDLSYENSLRALAMTSIAQVLQEIFKLFNDRICEIRDIY